MKSALFGSLLCLGLSGIPTFAAEDTAQIKQLTVEDAKRVGTGGRGALNLDGVTTLSDEAAKALEAASRRELFLNSLTTLSPAAARSICKAELDLHLNGLKTISDEALKAMSEHRAHPDLGRPFVHFKGLTTISDDGAAILAAWPKWSGELPSLTALSEKAAASLAGSRNWDGRLPAMATLPAETARGLAQWNGSLSLDGLTTLTDAVAVALAPHRGGTLSFNGLKTLSDGAAAALAGREGRLSLNGLTTLSSGTAKALAAHKGDWLFLDGLTTLSDDAAKSLAQHRGVVSLIGLTTLTADALRLLKANPRIVHSEKFRTAAIAGKPVAADAKLLRSFLDSHCASCHDQGEKEGDFALDRLAQDNVAGRVAYASILERLRAGDMPPSKKPRPDAAEAAAVMKWIQAKLDAPLPGKPAYFVVKEKPIDGNRLPNAILFGGPRGPSVPPPPRLWRISPDAYNSWLGEFKAGGLQPFGIIQDAGFKDFSALYSPDEGASGLLLSNAEQLVGGQASAHKLVNVNETPSTIKGPVWPDEARAKTATPKEQEALKAGIRVSSGKSVFAPLLHPQVRANPEELAKALQSQYMVAVARPPDAKEIESLLALYNKIAAFGDCSIAGKTVLMAPLMIPEAILRFEVGLGAEVRPGVRMLSPRETAFALSLAFSPKRDPGLLTAAGQGKLTTREEVAENVRQILANPKIGKSRIVWFFREYFDYYRAPEVFKDPLPSYQQRRGDNFPAQTTVYETDALVMAILARDKDVLKDLLTTNESYATGPNGHLNGLASGEALFQPFGPVALKTRYESQGGRIGIPMQRSWHIAWSTNFHNDIVRRGRWVRERLLGGRVPDLPINAAAMVPDDPHHTLRQRQMVTREANCWKCHNKMDELGLPFEDFDHYARPRRGEEILDLAAMERLKEQAKDKQAKDKKAKDQVPKLYREAPLDTTGTIANSGDPTVDGPVKDAPQMLRRLAESERVRQIFIRHVFRYFMGRNETPGDAVTLQEAEKAYLESGGSFKALLVSLLSSESFLYRTVPVAASKS
jgi:mono/diheme cytochrome c family protein